MTQHFLDVEHPANVRAVTTLAGGAADKPVIAAPADASDAYYGCGAHPDVVERVWDVIGKALPADCRCIAFGKPALVRPASGVILAVCIGTAYLLRIPQAEVAEALALGSKQSHEWGPHGSGDLLNLVTSYGSDWVMGTWLDQEIEWCARVFETFNVPHAERTQ